MFKSEVCMKDRSGYFKIGSGLLGLLMSPRGAVSSLVMYDGEGMLETLSARNVLKHNSLRRDARFGVICGLLRGADGWEGFSTSEQGALVGVSSDGGSATAEYAFERFRISSSFGLKNRNLIVWRIELENKTDRTAVFGALGFPIPFATDLHGMDVSRECFERRMRRRFYTHVSINGASSRVRVTRVSGGNAWLDIFPGAGTSFDNAYTLAETATSQAGHFGWPGLGMVSFFSKALVEQEDWAASPWGNGELALAPREKRVLTVNLLYRNAEYVWDHDMGDFGKLEIVPTGPTVVPLNMAASFAILTSGTIENATSSDGTTVEFRRDEKNSRLWHLGAWFEKTGEKLVTVVHGNGDGAPERSFFVLKVVPPFDKTIRARAEYVLARQTVADEKSQAHHALVPHNNRAGTPLTAPKYYTMGIGEALFIAAKNLLHPVAGEIAVLENYVSRFIPERVINPGGNVVGLAELDERTFERRPHVAVMLATLYRLLYRIGVVFGLTKHRRSKEYLELAYKTARRIFYLYDPRDFVCETVPSFGLLMELARDLADAGYVRQSEKLSAEIRTRNAKLIAGGLQNLKHGGAGLTGAEDLFLAAVTHGDFALAEALRARIFAARSVGPNWFTNGSEKFFLARGDYSERAHFLPSVLNSKTALYRLERVPLAAGSEQVRAAFAGLGGIFGLIDDDGAAAGFYRPDPAAKRPGPEGKSGWIGYALFTYLTSAVSAVVGLDGRIEAFLCQAAAEDGGLKVVPKDGVEKGVIVQPYEMRVHTDLAKIRWAWFDANRRTVRLFIENHTACDGEECIRLSGLWGRVGVVRESADEIGRGPIPKGVLKVRFPMRAGQTREIELKAF